MKTKLLKLALCAFVAALPIGAWADSEVWSINYAKLATDNVTYGESPVITANKSTTEKVTINSNTLTTYAFSQSTYLAENNVWVNRDNLLLRFKDINTIGLYHASQTCFNIKNVQEGDVIEIAYKGTDIGENDVYNATVSTTTSTYIHHYAYGDNNDRTFVYDKVYTLTAGNESTNVGFMLQGGYFLGKITVTRPSNTACSVSTPTGTAAGNNANTELPTGSGVYTASATWGGSDYVFTLTSASACIRNYNNGNANRKVGNNIAIQLTNNTINISHSPNIKSIKLYALTNATSGSQATITVDGSTNLGTAPLLGSEAVTPEEFDITNYSSIKASSHVLVAFEIEYYAGAELTVADINWASLYLPVAVAIPSGVKAYYASAISSSSVTLTELTGNIPANTGVLVKASEGIYTFNALQSDATPLPGTNHFDGVTSDKAFADSEIYVLAGSENDKANPIFKLYDSGSSSGVTLSAYKSYLLASNVPSLASTLTFGFDDDETTGITDVKINTENGTTQYYDLSGRRVTHPTKGLYIVNGKKVIIK